MNERAELPSAISIDSGVILAYLLGERTGELVRSSIFTDSAKETRTAYCSGATVAELFYLLCRRKGPRFARGTLDTVLGSGYLSRFSSKSLDVEAGRYKCSRSISLADCYVLATAKLLNAAALFAKREDDVVREIKKAPLDVRILFLEDLVP